MKNNRITLTIITAVIMAVIMFTTILSVSAETQTVEPTENTTVSTETTVQPTTDVSTETPTENLTETPTQSETEAPTEYVDPSIPHIKSATNTNSGIKITWSKVNGAKKYRVFVRSGSSWKTIGDTKSTSFTYKNVKNNKTYTFTVRCISSNGKKYTSGFDKTGYKATYYSAPKLSGAKNTTSGVKVTWKAVSGIDKYRVYVKGGSAKGWKKKADVTGTSYTHTSAASGTKYTYTVRCLSDEGKVVSSYNSKGKSITYIAAPKVSKLQNTSSGTKLTWSKSKGAYKYRVFVKSGSSWKTIGNTKSTSFTYKNVKNNKTYTYTVRCLNKDGKYISAYNKNGYSYTYFSSPSISSVKNTTSGVKVTWKEINGIDTYRLYVKKNNSTSWSTLADVTDTSYTHSDVTSGDKYIYTVRCIKDGKSVSSFNSKGKSITYIATPYISDATLSDKNVTLKWNSIEGAYKYRVFVKSGSEWKGVGYTTSTKYTVKNLKTDKSYTYTVRCCDKDGNYISAYDTSGFTVTVAYIVDQEAYTEEKPLYEQRIRGICNKCGKDLADDLIPVDSEYFGWDGYKYHILVEGCESAWHTETRWFVIADNIEVNEQQYNDLSNIYLYNDTHSDQLEYRYLYSAICRVSDCEYNLEHPIYSCVVKNKNDNIKSQLQNILNEHALIHKASGERTDGNVAVQQLVYQITSYPKLSHYELIVG